MKLLKKYGAHRWALGFVRGGIDTVMTSDSLEVDWIKMPADRWYADPFVLDVTETEILLLVEDYGYDVRKGVISLLHINRDTMDIISRKVLLELTNHLSFPAILRKDEHVYIYPESRISGRLDMYEFHPKTESLSFVSTICDDEVWDSVITKFWGEPLMFTAAHDDYQLDIYRWNDSLRRFVPYLAIPSEKPNTRMGGAVFEYNGEYYYPAQDCSRVYGGAIDIKRIDYQNGNFMFTEIKKIKSPNRKYSLGLHTINEYKGVVVIDVKGYTYGWIGEVIAWMVKIKKQIKKNFL